MANQHQEIAGVIQPYLFQNGFILADLPVKDLAVLQQNVQIVAHRRGEWLFRQGGFPKGAYWLISGKAKIFQEMPDGQRHTNYIYSNGDLIAFRQLIAGEVHPVSAALLEDSTVGLIPAETFRDLLNSSPFFTRNILTALAREFSVWMNRMTVFTQFPVRKRLVLALLMLHEQYRLSGNPVGVITMTRSELAEYIGASLETVVRGLHVLKERDLVRIHGRQIVLPNALGLLEILQKEDG